jgi:hypothetical protein
MLQQICVFEAVLPETIFSVELDKKNRPWSERSRIPHFLDSRFWKVGSQMVLRLSVEI